MFLSAMLTDGVSKCRPKRRVCCMPEFTWEGATRGASPRLLRNQPKPRDTGRLSEFETWFESEGKKPAKEELDAALEKKFGPYPDS